MNTLDKAVINSNAVIKSIEGSRPTKRRLMDMGLIPGAKIFIRKTAPLGDPIEITVKNIELTLRKADAMNIYIETIA